ncbi:uncharacterized protein LOC134195288 [Corticium candelabrum]|uniref:uncharacterized protein LOC134195288 n=1 Tax=Corticium candelabrum TaxID=121492 RepID=UPI002E27246E|nr:uncharacterized protein LOC134195288 [Corticium candelabrum]
MQSKYGTITLDTDSKVQLGYETISITEGVEPGVYGHYVDSYSHPYYDFRKGNGTVELYNGSFKVATIRLPYHSKRKHWVTFQIFTSLKTFQVIGKIIDDYNSLFAEKAEEFRLDQTQG